MKTVLTRLYKQDTEINKLNNVIDKMVERIKNCKDYDDDYLEGIEDDRDDNKCFLYGKIDDCYEFKNCKECIKEYFMKEDK